MPLRGPIPTPVTYEAQLRWSIAHAPMMLFVNVGGVRNLTRPALPTAEATPLKSTTASEPGTLTSPWEMRSTELMFTPEPACRAVKRKFMPDWRTTRPMVSVVAELALLLRYSEPPRMLTSTLSGRRSAAVK